MTESEYAKIEYEFLDAGYPQQTLKSLGVNLERKKILDLGAGPGQWLVAVKTLGAKEFYWSDISLIYLKLAKEYHKKYRLENIHYVIEDISNIRYPNNFFDFIICREALHHAQNQKMAIKKIWHTLKEGGFAYLEVVTYNRVLWKYPWSHPDKIIALIAPIITPIFGKFLPVLSCLKFLIKRYLKNVGFVIIKEDYQGYTWRVLIKKSGTDKI